MVAQMESCKSSVKSAHRGREMNLTPFAWPLRSGDNVADSRNVRSDSGVVFMAKRSRSRGIRPGRNAVVSGMLGLAGIALVIAGVIDVRIHNGNGAPWLVLGMFPALLGPIAFFHYVRHAGRVRAMRRGEGLIARWTVPADAFRRFREAEARIPARSVIVNYYRPPESIPEAGVEVRFADSGVLIGEGYFPLSATGSRRVECVRHAEAVPDALEFSIGLVSRARTSSVTSQSTRTLYVLRVPVARDAGHAANAVLRHYRAK
mgnify:CR=1 FL=1